MVDRPHVSQETRTVQLVWQLTRIILMFIVLWIAIGALYDAKREKPNVHPGEPTAGSQNLAE